MNLTSSQHVEDVSSWCYKKMKGKYSVECAPWRTLWVTRCRIHANTLLFWHVQHGSWNALHRVPRPQKEAKNVAFGRDWLLLWVISGSDQGVGAVFYSVMSTAQTSRFHVKIGNVTVSAEYSTNVGRKLSKYSELIWSTKRSLSHKNRLRTHLFGDVIYQFEDACFHGVVYQNIEL